MNSNVSGLDFPAKSSSGKLEAKIENTKHMRILFADIYSHQQSFGFDCSRETNTRRAFWRLQTSSGSSSPFSGTAVGTHWFSARNKLRDEQGIPNDHQFWHIARVIPGPASEPSPILSFTDGPDCIAFSPHPPSAPPQWLPFTTTRTPSRSTRALQC